MQLSRQQLQERFYLIKAKEQPLQVFEEWVYAHENTLEKIVPEAVYLHLLSFNYKKKSKYLYDEFLKDLEDYIDEAGYEDWRIRRVLDSIIERKTNWIECLLETYHLYNEGYDFFSDLGMHHAFNLLCRVDFEWEIELMITNLSDKDYNNIKHSALQVKAWLDTSKIVLTGQVNKDSQALRYDYEDYRTGEDYANYEKEYATIAETTREHTSSETFTVIEASQPKKWWQWWR